MSRRSLNYYQRKFRFFPIKKFELFLHKKIKLIIANTIKKNLIDEGASKDKIKVIYNGFIRPKDKHKGSSIISKKN